MPLPKSVVKINKDGVQFTESVDRASFLISELTRRAMNDVGKYVIRICRQNVRDLMRSVGKRDKQGQTRVKKYPIRYQYWVPKKENILIVGVENLTKGARTAWFADQAELGTAGQPKRGFLRNAVYNNIDTIRKIEAQYLSAIEDELNAESLIDEGENDPEAEV